MSPSVLPMAEHFPKLVWGKGLLWRALIDRPSLNSVTTASSAASSSWGSGTRIFNGWGNMLLEGAKLTLIAANSAAAIQQGLTRPLGIPIERSVEPPWYFASNTGGCGYTVEPRVTRPPKN